MVHIVGIVRLEMLMGWWGLVVREPPRALPFVAERGPGSGLFCWCLAFANYPLSTPPTILGLVNVAFENRVIESLFHG